MLIITAAITNGPPTADVTTEVAAAPTALLPSKVAAVAVTIEPNPKVETAEAIPA